MQLILLTWLETLKLHRGFVVASETNSCLTSDVIHVFC